MIRPAIAAIGVVAGLAGRAEARGGGCHEISLVVGEHRCRGFGEWSRDQDVPRLWIELGYFRHHYISHPFTLDRSGLAPNIDYSTEAAGGSVRILGAFVSAVYTGVEFDAGYIADVPPIEPKPNFTDYFGMNAVAGAHVSVFRFGLGAELAGGFRYQSLKLCQHPKCVGDPGEDETRPLLEARARVEWFVTPEFSFGGTVGKSLIDSNDRTFLVVIGVHTRAMDGMP
jgi:hypothetical protein